ncbi:MAG TPA: DUF6776 family protein [Gammaproteobacteria bacterium]
MKYAPRETKYLISVHKPELWLLSVLAVFAAVAVVVWGAYMYGQHTAGFDQSDYDEEIEILRQALDEQTAEKERVLRDNARLSRGSDIQKDASGKISNSLAECKDESIKLKEELTFYKNIVAPRKSEREIKINKVTVAASGDVFNYKVALIQVGKHDVLQRGYVEISFTGRRADGTEVSYDLPAVSVDEASKRQRFGFKYFQNFEGSIRFPEGIEPLSVNIKALPNTSRVPSVEQDYDWDELIAGGSESNVGQE